MLPKIELNHKVHVLTRKEELDSVRVTFKGLRAGQDQRLQAIRQSPLEDGEIPHPGGEGRGGRPI